MNELSGPSRPRWQTALNGNSKSFVMNGKHSNEFCCQVERKKVFKFHILGATSQNMKNVDKIVLSV